VLLLALDTATPALTVALHDGSRALAGQTLVSTRKHGELLAAMIEQVLAAGGASRGDLEAIAVGTGPGPYTGLRAGLVTARVLASALGIPAVGVCTLDVIARSAVEAAAGREFLVASDARRKELYWARYAADGQRMVGPEVGSPSALGGDDPHYNPPGASLRAADLLPAARASLRPAVAAGTGLVGRKPARGAGQPLGPTSGRPSRLASRLTPPAGVPVAGEGSASEEPVAGEVPVAGEGAVLYPGITAWPIPPVYPDAGVLAVMGAEVLAAGGPVGVPEPLYLRRPDAQVPGRPKRVTP
jgi:tRNA threonylcarbamoyl adenosine modification protein YeaZ